MSDEQSSDRELDISTVVNGSGSDDKSTHNRSYDKFISEGPCTSCQSTPKTDSQNLVNEKNLDQLITLSQPLDKH